MPTWLAAFAQSVSESPSTVVPIALVLALTASSIGTPASHSLLVSSLSWACVWIYGCLKIGPFTGIGSSARLKNCCKAGALFALAQVCERAARDGEGLRWTKALLPLLASIIIGAGSLSALPSSRYPDEQTTSGGILAKGSKRLLIFATVSAVTVSSASFITSPAIALGLCSALFTAAGLVVLEGAVSSNRDEKLNGSGGYVHANGSVLRRHSPQVTEHEAHIATMRDVSVVIALACASASLLLESYRPDGLVYRARYSDKMGSDWRRGQRAWGFAQAFVMVVVGMVQNVTWVVMTGSQGAVRTGFAALASALVTRLVTRPTIAALWFSMLCIPAVYLYIEDSATGRAIGVGSWRRVKARTAILALGVISFGIFAATSFPSRLDYSEIITSRVRLQAHPPTESFGPLQLADRTTHPIAQLLKDAEEQMQATISGQSQSLEDAVREYRRRYRIPPPPNFDKWYEFAKRKGVQLIDEYDTIYDSLLPFWGLEPATIRSRVREAMGFGDNGLVKLLIRGGQVTLVDGGDDYEWMQQALTGMVKDFVQFLPDVDLAFNIHDEPRVVVSAERLARLVNVAKDERMPAAFSNQAPKNFFSSKPEDLNDGKQIDEVKITRFNVFAHQPTWTHSRMSCTSDSPAQFIDDNPKDNLTSYALSELGFVYNHTAFSDVCQSPSLRETFGLFERPNAFNVVHDLFPIFSQSKVSSYQDILYPSPWYWFGKVAYEEGLDMDWHDKENKLYWRGSTTGGFSRHGGWRRQHRQRVVRRLNAPDEAQILANEGDSTAASWQTLAVKRADYKDIIDVRFSHIGQCDPADFDAQTEFFDVAPVADQQDAWKFKHLLDMDGNAFSGRFYAFLQSHSLVYKMALFQEWHKDWLKPWVHFIPLSLRGDEWLECVRYFSADEAGQEKAPKMAEAGRDWAKKVLRNEDFEAWFFRLLLEYGRVVDDNRESIGYPGP